jgi:hypothetical protein
VVLIPNLDIDVLGGIQPDALRKVLEDTVDDGLIQRLHPLVLRTATESMDIEPIAGHAVRRAAGTEAMVRRRGMTNDTPQVPRRHAAVHIRAALKAAFPSARFLVKSP